MKLEKLNIAGWIAALAVACSQAPLLASQPRIARSGRHRPGAQARS